MSHFASCAPHRRSDAVCHVPSYEWREETGALLNGCEAVKPQLIIDTSCITVRRLFVKELLCGLSSVKSLHNNSSFGFKTPPPKKERKREKRPSALFWEMERPWTQLPTCAGESSRWSATAVWRTKPSFISRCLRVETNGGEGGWWLLSDAHNNKTQSKKKFQTSQERNQKEKKKRRKNADTEFPSRPFPVLRMSAVT